MKHPITYAFGARSSEMPIPAPDKAIVTVLTPGVQRKRRAMYRKLLNVPEQFVPISCDLNDAATLRDGFAKRLLRENPPPDEAIIAELFTHVRTFCDIHFDPIEPLSFQEWLDSLLGVNISRKRELQARHDELNGEPPTKRQCSHIDTFGKTEFYPEYKHARMINSRSDYFKVWSGPWFKAMERVVYKLPWFIKHIPVASRPSVIMSRYRPGLKIYSTDFSSFESSFSRPIMLAVECQLYRHLMGNHCRDARVLTQTLVGCNRMRTRTGIHAEVNARRMSGDMCTSLGNGFTNYMLYSFIVSKKLGKYTEPDGFVEGDDGLFYSPVTLCGSDYTPFGFIMKVIHQVQHPGEASFCGCLFSDAQEIIKDPTRAITSLSWTHSFLTGSDKLMSQLLRAKAMSMACELPQCPIVGMLARHVLILTTGVNPRFVYDGYHLPPVDFDIPCYSPAPATRVFFSQLFGISIDDQVVIENAIALGDLTVLNRLKAYPDQINYASRFLRTT